MMSKTQSGQNGKGDDWRETDWKKYWESEYWSNVEKRKEAAKKAEKKTAR